MLTMLFRRPEHKRENLFISFLENSPIWLLIIALVTNKYTLTSFYFNQTIIKECFCEEIFLRFLPLQLVSKTIFNCIFSGLFFMLYYLMYTTTQVYGLHIIIFTLLGILYAFGERKFSFIEMVLYRVLFTMVIIN